MSEPKFTPGPWVIDGEWPNNRSKGHGIISGAIGQPREHRAMVQFVNELDGDPYCEGVANAHLIAAAPELYEALKAYVHAMEGFAEAVRHVTNTPFPWEPGDIALKQAKAALSKARGET